MDETATETGPVVEVRKWGRPLPRFLRIAPNEAGVPPFMQRFARELRTELPRDKKQPKRHIFEAARRSGARFRVPVEGSAEAERTGHTGYWRTGVAPPPVITEQYRADGARQFRCQTWPHFLAEYAALPPARRTFYEHVRPDQPARLYFDLDAKHLADADGRCDLRPYYARTAAFAAWVCAALSDACPPLRELAKRRGEPVAQARWLDASCAAEGRFSVHLVFDLAGPCLFAGAADATRFVHWLLEVRAPADGWPPCTRFPHQDARAEALAESSAEDAAQGPSVADWPHLVDRSVYTPCERRPNLSHEFRLPFSHKVGQPKRSLRPLVDPLRLGVDPALASLRESGRLEARPLVHPPVHSDGDAQAWVYTADALSADTFYPFLVGYEARKISHLLHVRYEAKVAGHAGDAAQVIARTLDVGGGTQVPVRISAEATKGLKRSRATRDAEAGDQASEEGGHDAGERPSKRLRAAASMPTQQQQQQHAKEEEEEEEQQGQEEGGDKQGRDKQTHPPAVDREQLLHENREEIASALEALLPAICDAVKQSMPGLPDLQLVGWSPTHQALQFTSLNQVCEIKGGAHSKNHLYYIVWLDSKTYYQRCRNTQCYETYIDRRRQQLEARLEKSEAARRLNEQKAYARLRGPGYGAARGHLHTLPATLWADIDRVVDLSGGPPEGSRAGAAGRYRGAGAGGGAPLYRYSEAQLVSAIDGGESDRALDMIVEDMQVGLDALFDD